MGGAVSLAIGALLLQDSASPSVPHEKMVERVVDVRTIIVADEIEALILEANLIKRHQPVRRTAARRRDVSRT